MLRVLLPQVCDRTTTWIQISTTAAAASAAVAVAATATSTALAAHLLCNICSCNSSNRSSSSRAESAAWTGVSRWCCSHRMAMGAIRATLRRPTTASGRTKPNWHIQPTTPATALQPATNNSSSSSARQTLHQPAPRTRPTAVSRMEESEPSKRMFCSMRLTKHATRQNTEIREYI